MSTTQDKSTEKMAGPKRMMGGPHGGMQGPGEKPKNFKKSFKRLFALLGAYRGLLVFAVLCAVIGVVVSAFSPMILGMVTTELYSGVRNMMANTGGFDWQAIIRLLVILAATYVVSPLFRFMQNVTMVKVSQKIVYSLRQEISSKLDRLPLSYYDSRSRGDIMSRVTNDVDTISQSLQEGISQALVAVITIIALLVMMLTINVWMTLVGLCMLPVSMLITKAIIKKSQKYFIGNQRNLGVVNGHVEEMYGGHEVVKAFGQEEASMEKFDQANEQLYEDGWKSNFFSSMMMPIVGFAGNIGYVFVVVMGAIFTSRGVMPLGDIQAFIQYLRRFNQPVGEVASIANVFQSTMAASERVFDLLDEPDEPADVPDAYEGPKQAAGTGNIVFDHVKFGYSPDKILINDFNVTVPSGTKVAIVGPTGAGKTTLINLLMRFYDVDGGSITVDGHDVRNWKRDDLHDQFGMVLQDTWLFNGSVAQNISYGTGDPDQPLAKVREAARMVCADHFIQTLPNGYDLVVTEDGDNLSSGEKQLVTIARAVISDPRFLILDEATSNVDTRTEALIQQAMKSLMEGRTSFIIAHRLSTIRDADLILVMKDGDIVEQGTHASLLAADGFYAQLYNSQFASKAVS